MAYQFKNTDEHVTFADALLSRDLCKIRRWREEEFFAPPPYFAKVS
ncbi:hypothetical protein [Porphyromonas gingivalis]|nr:hypothetical protein [Porphyromonas gingivalis]